MNTSEPTLINDVEINTNNITNTSTTQQLDDLAKPIIKQQLVAESSPSGARAKLKEITAKDNKQSKGKSSISKAMNGSSDFGTGKLTSENLLLEADEVMESYKDYTTKLEGLVHMLHVRVDQLEFELEDSHKKIAELTKRNTTPVDTHANAHTSSAHTEVKDESKTKKSKGKDKLEHTNQTPPAHSTTPSSEKHETPTPDKHETPVENVNSKPVENKHQHEEKKSEEKKSEKAENNKKQKRNPKATTNGEGN